MHTAYDGALVGVCRAHGVAIRYHAEKSGGAYSICAAADDGSESRAKGVTSSRKTALKIIEILVKNAVFPCHLHEVLEDLLAEGHLV